MIWREKKTATLAHLQTRHNRITILTLEWQWSGEKTKMPPSPPADQAEVGVGGGGGGTLSNNADTGMTEWSGETAMLTACRQNGITLCVCFCFVFLSHLMYKMLENVVKCSEFVYTSIWHTPHISICFKVREGKKPTSKQATDSWSFIVRSGKPKTTNKGQEKKKKKKEKNLTYSHHYTSWANKHMCATPPHPHPPTHTTNTPVRPESDL